MKTPTSQSSMNAWATHLDKIQALPKTAEKPIPATKRKQWDLSKLNTETKSKV